MVGATEDRTAGIRWRVLPGAEADPTSLVYREGKVPPDLGACTVAEAPEEPTAKPTVCPSHYKALESLETCAHSSIVTHDT